MYSFVEFIVEHFIELFFILGFTVFSFIFKLYKYKQSVIVYTILALSFVLILYDGLIKLQVINAPYVPLLFLVLFNVYLFSLLVLPKSKMIHIIMAFVYIVGITLSLIINKKSELVLCVTSILFFVVIFINSFIRCITKKELFESLFIDVFTVVDIICLYLQSVYPNTILINEMVLISSIIIFITFVVKNNNDKKVEEEKKIQMQRTSIAISQIQPHFLYNSLATIGYICKKDAAKASEAIDKFSDYLRANLNSLRTDNNIPFKEELRHVQTYLWLEKLRFDDRLNIVFDINVDDFFVPPLSVQPLVENAVKHGICEKLEGGTLYIRTVEYNETIKIVIEDTGVGFDTKKKPSSDRAHVGIENVTSRIKNMAGGELVITSRIGKGTISTITLPKEKV